MPHFIFVRHGESEINAANRAQRVFCGQTDTPLTDRGREQAKVVGKQIAGMTGLRITTAISSTLQRCVATLDLILAELPYAIERLPPSPRLNERSLGVFEGRIAEKVYAQYPQYRDDPDFNQFDNHFVQKAPDGENLREVTDRAWPLIESLSGSSDGDVLIVSHYGVIRCLLGRALNLPELTIPLIKAANATPILLERGERFRLVSGIEIPPVK